MTDPATYSAVAIAEIAFQTFLKSGVGELSKKFTKETIHKISQLRNLILDKLRDNSNATMAIMSIEDGTEKDLSDVIAYLKSSMKNDKEFASKIQVLANEIYTENKLEVKNITQNNYGNAKASQFNVESGSTIHISM